MSNKVEEKDYWNRIFSREDPWDYSSAYEQRKYRLTLEMVPDKSIPRALELGCAEGLFTKMLVEKVDDLLAADISDNALQRARDSCVDIENVRFEQHDIADGIPAGEYDLIVCSELLYYLRDRYALEVFASQVKEALATGGYLLMTHANMVSDDKSRTGFDFNEIGAQFIGEIFSSESELEFLRELRTPLYRVQLFRRSYLSTDHKKSVPNLPREVVERDASFEHPSLKIGGCVVTAAEARHCWVTREVPILMYHRVAEDGPTQLSPYRVSPADFERQLAYLQRYGYHSIRLDDFYAIWFERNVRELPGRPVILTFDDAYLDFFETAWPLLRKYGFDATVFIPTSHVAGHAEWDRRHGEPAKLMKWEQIIELHENGINFGSHGCSHELLTEMSSAEVLDDAVESKAILEKKLDVQISGYCYPYCAANSSSQKTLAEAGYTYAVGGVGGNPPDRENCFYIPRIEIFRDDGIDEFIAKLPKPELADISQRMKYDELRAIRDRATYMNR